jgi:hypothetical protein
MRVILDAVREVTPPFSPENVVAEFATLLESYRIRKISGDRYAGLWPVEQFAKFGVRYEQAAKPKPELYVDSLPLINSRSIELLDNQRLFNQLCGLDRRTVRGGRESIDHAPGGHDDIVNAVADVASLAKKPAYDSEYKGWADSPLPDGGPLVTDRRSFYGMRFISR